MALTKLQHLILFLFKKSLLADQFYWTGGTLLSERYLRHRDSQDIDLFSDQPFSYEKIFALIRIIKREGKLKRVEGKKIFDRWEFFLSEKSGPETRLDFVFFDFPRLKPLQKWQGIWIDSLDDCVANKTSALVERHQPKDIIDIYFLIKERNYTPQKMLDLFQKKFGIKYSLSVFWSEAQIALASLEEIKPILRGTVEHRLRLLNAVRTYFENQAADFIKKQIDK